MADPAAPFSWRCKRGLAGLGALGDLGSHAVSLARRFTPAPGHGLGFNDLKPIEVAHLLDGIAHGRPLYPDFRERWAIEATCEAMAESAARRAWITVGEPA